MTETDTTHHHSQSEFRQSAIKHILHIRTKISSFSRSLQFHAITIIDAYEKSLKTKVQNIPDQSPDPFTYSMASLFLACKFNGTNQKLFQNFLCQLNSTDKEETHKMKILQAEANILQMMDFEIPIETCFTSLEHAAETDAQSEQKKKPIYKACLKILLVSCSMNSELSERSFLGGELYELIKTKTGKRRVIQLHQEARKALKAFNTQ